MTTFYAKSKMAYPEYRYNILNTDFKPVYETDGRLRLGGKASSSLRQIPRKKSSRYTANPT